MGAWPRGYERRLVFKRSWVQIPAPVTVWTFFTFKYIVCLKRLKINGKEAMDVPFLKTA